MPLTIRQLQEAVVARSEESLHPVDDWTPLEYAGCLSEEVGELHGFLKRIRRLEDGDRPYNKGVDQESLRQGAGKELADIVKYACLVAQRMELDLEDLVVAKFNEVSERVGSPRRIGGPVL